MNLIYKQFLRILYVPQGMLRLKAPATQGCEHTQPTRYFDIPTQRRYLLDPTGLIG